MIDAGEAEPVDVYFQRRNRFLRSLPVHDTPV
jgi:hypothetical protein